MQRQATGCVGESPSWLRHWILIPAFQGSNPCSPAIKSKEKTVSRQCETLSPALAAFQTFNDCIQGSHGARKPVGFYRQCKSGAGCGSSQQAWHPARQDG